MADLLKPETVRIAGIYRARYPVESHQGVRLQSKFQNQFNQPVFENNIVVVLIELLEYVALFVPYILRCCVVYGEGGTRQSL